MGFPLAIHTTQMAEMATTLCSRKQGEVFSSYLSLYYLAIYVQGFLNIPNSLLHNICKLALSAKMVTWPDEQNGFYYTQFSKDET